MEKILKLIFIVFLFTLFSKVSFAASLFTTPTSGTFNVGDKVTLKIMVSSDLPINAISGVVNFPPIFLIESISKSSSILNFWVTEPNFSKGAGTLQFEGVSLGGFSSGTGNVVTVVLKANKEGTGDITFKSGQILANDGQGTDLTGSFSGSSFLVKPKIVEPVKTQTEEQVKEEVKEEIEEEIKKEPILLPPQISLEKMNGENIISGVSSYKLSKVLITITNEENNKVFLLLDADSNGNFKQLVPKSLKYGTYKANATIINKDLLYSPLSNEIIIEVGNVFSDISLEVKIGMLLLILIILILIIKLFFFIKNNKNRKYFNKKELKEAEEVVRKSFKIINDDIERDFPKRMTISEQQDKEEIKEDLDQAEEVILKEIKDIKK